MKNTTVVTTSADATVPPAMPTARSGVWVMVKSVFHRGLIVAERAGSDEDGDARRRQQQDSHHIADWTGSLGVGHDTKVKSGEGDKVDEKHPECDQQQTPPCEPADGADSG